MKPRLAGRFALILALTVLAPAQAQTADHLIVSPTGPYTTIQSALADARDGDTIEVRAGTYAGPIVVDTSVTLEGMDWPIIDGGEKGTVVTLAAADITFRGFEVRGSGVEPDRDHAGITLTAPHITVEGNRLRDVLFGIFVSQADDAIVRGNDVTSKSEYDIGRKGDSIRLWYSQRVTVEGNHVHGARDVVMWYSTDVRVRDNLIETGRYGLHLMYCDGATIEHNRVLNNSVGIYAMYSDRIVLSENLIRGQRGPSGYALGFKDADQVEVTGNLLVDNGGGAFIDGTPFRPQGYAHFQKNIVAFNDVGVILQPAVRGASFENNTFWENVEQVAVQGGGLSTGNRWAGNSWSDYAGFDADADGLGDVPYRSERFFESLTDREPRLRALLYSPAAQAIEFAATAFPVARPQPKFTDANPRLDPLTLPPFAEAQSVGPTRASHVALALLGLGIVCGWLALGRSRPFGRGLRRNTLTKNFVRVHPRASRSAPGLSAERGASPMAVQVKDVSKQYGKVKALHEVSFEARSGEAIALWGANGAGKTTLLKAIIGLIDIQGEIQVEGHAVRRYGKLARRMIGYVPQEAVFYDWSTQATMEFYARLKKVGGDRIPALLDRLGLADHARKSVSALSGGLKQRLALAIALLADPPVLLLDEPTASLDAQARADYLALLASLRHDGRTVLFTSHRLEEVEVLADRILMLEQGRLVESLLPEELRARFDPRVEMTLWVPDGQRVEALACLEQEGLDAHLNGRGTLVVRVHPDHKMRPLDRLKAQGIGVTNFEVERSRSWN